MVDPRVRMQNGCSISLCTDVMRWRSQRASGGPRGLLIVRILRAEGCVAIKPGEGFSRRRTRSCELSELATAVKDVLIPRRFDTNAVVFPKAD